MALRFLFTSGKPKDIDWALVQAIKAGNREILKLLFQNGADVIPRVVRALANPQNSEHDAENFETILQVLLDNGWGVNLELDGLGWRGAIMYVIHFTLE